MAITLSDITAATAAYIDDQVDVTIRDVTTNLNPNEEGSFTVKVTNAAEPTGVRLHDIVLHVTVDPPGIASLIPPGSALLTPRATNDGGAPRLSTSDRVESMFVFLNGSGSIEPNPTLDVGEVLELELGYEADARGTTTISCHVHATVEPDDVFPRGPGRSGSGDIRVRA